MKIGLCSPETEHMLLQQTCIDSVYSLPSRVRLTIDEMIQGMCRSVVGDFGNHQDWSGPLPPCAEDCITTLTNSGTALTYEDPGFLTDCGDLVQDSCLSMLFTDFTEAGGVCSGSHGDVELGWQVSESVCSVKNISGFLPHHVVEGLCRPETEAALRAEQCMEQVRNITTIQLRQKYETYENDMIGGMIRSLCNTDVFYDFYPQAQSPPPPPPPRPRPPPLRKERNIAEKQALKKKFNSKEARLNPIEQVRYEQAQKPVFEQTRGRYPWICSLRSKSSKSHYCGTTILSRPPGPLVMVTAAHCVFLCKAEGKTRPNFCCPNVSNATGSADPHICGTNPRAEVMTGEDAEVVCGEFETGNYTAEESGEEFNTVLEIKNITVHPDYNISRGNKTSQFVVADIATIKVKEDLSQEEISRLTPVCLPQHQDYRSQYAVHAGWSSPPPLKFIQEKLPDHEPIYRDFSKMWHYNMSLTQCQDPTQYFLEIGPTGVNLTYPTNSSYPPGTVCAREKNFKFCPTSGESGSPLMVENEKGRYTALGLNSFIKGCSSFSSQYLFQFSENPSVYSRLICYLDWIAEQYGMTYSPTGEEDERCKVGTGDITEPGGGDCRTTPSNFWDTKDQTEAKCIFPFYLDGKEYNECALEEIQSFTRPQFVCPIRTIKGRAYNGRNYTAEDIGRKYFPTNAWLATIMGSCDVHCSLVYAFNGAVEVRNEYNGEWELDSDNDNADITLTPFRARPVFATCKNTCPGGETKTDHTNFL